MRSRRAARTLSAGFATVATGHSMDFQEKHKLKERIIKLKLEHNDLDMAISRLADDPTSDELQLTRLKKRKLQLKDTISRLQSMLIPDLDA
ncbi:MAG TPA: YdcH family protein [Gammaproteobacteria bacterium]